MLTIGTRFTLETIEEGKIKERYHCKVAEITRQNIYIDYPINEQTGRSSMFLDGTEIFVSFVSNDHNVYRFPTEVVGRKKINIPVLMIRMPKKEQIIKIQRREYVRVDVPLDIAIHPKNTNKPALISRTIDISGGGVAVVGNGMEHVYSSGDIVQLTLVLPFQSNHYSYFSSEAEVIRCISSANRQQSKITFKFVHIDDKQREQLIKFCFEKQLEERRKQMK